MSHSTKRNKGIWRVISKSMSVAILTLMYKYFILLTEIDRGMSTGKVDDYIGLSF